ncbi:hypothetical protein ACN3XK_54705 [Actinomadura welshii]
MRPRHRHCLAWDICRFTGRDVAAQSGVRNEMFTMIEGVCADLGIQRREGVHDDRGDGLTIVTKSPIEVLALDLPRQLGDAVRRYNLAVGPDRRMQLRQAMDAGYVHKDKKGYTGDPINKAARLLDAPDFKDRMRDEGAEFAVIVSAELCDAIQGFQLLDERKIQKVEVAVKSVHTTAFMWIP